MYNTVASVNWQTNEGACGRPYRQNLMLSTTYVYQEHDAAKVLFLPTA